MLRSEPNAFPLISGCIWVGRLILLLAFNQMYAASTLLFLQGEPGDFVVGNQTLTYHPVDGVFNVRILTNRPFSTVAVSFYSEGSDGFLLEWWDLRFAAPLGSLLAPGYYPNATRYPFQAAAKPGFDASGTGRGCSQLTASFTIHELVSGPGDEVSSFWATFEQHCEGSMPALRGEIRWNAHVPVEIGAPSRLIARVGEVLTFNYSSLATNGEPVVLSVSNVPEGAHLDYSNPGSATFTWKPTANQIGIYDLVFIATNTSGQSEITHTRILAKAVVPLNDSFTNATVVSELPFVEVLNTGEATNIGEPSFCLTKNQTVWYAFTPTTNVTIEVSTLGSDFSGAFAVFAGAVKDAAFLLCGSDFARFRIEAGQTYYFQVGTPTFERGSNLVFSLARSPVEIPVNDEITNATAIATLPFAEELNTSVATVNGGDPSCISATRTVWYSFTPAADATLEAATIGSDFAGTLAVYRGSSERLVSVRCRSDRVRFRAVAGQTYYLQAGAGYFQNGTNLMFSLYETTDVDSFGISKSHLYLQKSATSKGSLFATLFRGWVLASTGDDVSFVKLQSPAEAVEVLPFTAPNEFSNSRRLRNRSVLERLYPAGDYTFSIGAVYDGTNNFTLHLPEKDFPNTPHVSNWKAAQIIAASEPFTLTWDALNPMREDDRISVEILDESRNHSVFRSPLPEAPNDLRPTDTSFVIPAGTLEPNKNYFGVITFARHPVIDTNLYPGAFAVVVFATAAGFPMRTVGVLPAVAQTLCFTSRRYSVSEANEAAVITVLRTGSASGVVTVDFATTDGAAVINEDYRSAAGSLLFADGETSKTFSIPILSDDLSEPSETFAVSLRNPTGARLGLRRASIAISDVRR